MPIRAENRRRYPADWPDISARVRAEAGEKCEWCGVHNGAMIYRGSDNQGVVSIPAYRYAGAPAFEASYHAQTGEIIPGSCWDTFDARLGAPARVVLTVAHLDHQPENCARENLRALCQGCHNAYDAPTRRRGIAERAKAARAVGDLFDGDGDGVTSAEATHIEEDD